MAQAAKAGAGIVKPAHDNFWGGYAGYFQDPDRHLWEVVWNPQWEAPEADDTALSAPAGPGRRPGATCRDSTSITTVSPARSGRPAR